MADSWNFVVRKDDLRQMDVLPAPAPDPAGVGPGKLLVAVDVFSLTANNVTYGALGVDYGYWQFYPASEPWGQIPAWGYATVLASGVEGIEVGEPIFGYLPMSTHATLVVDGVHEGGFTDISLHRRPLPAVYNRYRRVRPSTDPDHAARVAIFMPLYSTSWLLADMLADRRYFGAQRVLISSASSKTALGVGHALQRDFGSQVHTVGLTSAGNRDFAESTGHWDEVATYDELETLDPGIPTVYADIAGNAALRLRTHRHLGDGLVASISVGLAHWESTTPDPAEIGLPGPRPEVFFAPVRVEKRNADWGPAELTKRLSASQDAFAERSLKWMQVQTGDGPEAVRGSLSALIEGTVPPSVGMVVRP